MNERQERALTWLRSAIMNHDGRANDPDYEYKRFEVTEHPECHCVSLVTVVGLKGDEGTMAQIFARTHRHIWIGKRGGLKLLNAKHKSRAQGNRVVWELTDY